MKVNFKMDINTEKVKLNFQKMDLIMKESFNGIISMELENTLIKNMFITVFGRMMLNGDLELNKKQMEKFIKVCLLTDFIMVLEDFNIVMVHIFIQHLDME